jgi:hypothetical protein
MRHVENWVVVIVTALLILPFLRLLPSVPSALTGLPVIIAHHSHR